MDKAPDIGEPVYNTHQAASYLGVKPKTLRAWRCVERGPRFIKYGDKRGRGGLVFYPLSALDEFRESRQHITPEEMD